MRISKEREIIKSIAYIYIPTLNENNKFSEIAKSTPHHPSNEKTKENTHTISHPLGPHSFIFQPQQQIRIDPILLIYTITRSRLHGNMVWNDGVVIGGSHILV